MKICKFNNLKILWCLSIQAVLLLIISSVLWFMKENERLPSRDELLLTSTDGTEPSSETEIPLQHMPLAGERRALGTVSALPPSYTPHLDEGITTTREEATEVKGQVSTIVRTLVSGSSREASVSPSALLGWKAGSTSSATARTSPPPTGKNRILAKDFTAEPHWGFDEEYTLEHSSRRTTCPNSVKIKAAYVGWLKERFLPRISIFMDHRHFSNSEWGRLEHFMPPYGWMELNYTVAREVVSLLPHIPDQQILLADNSNQPPSCVSCAVVGNGGILNNSHLGIEIDSHDYIFRVNGAVLKGHESDVGNRTSFYGFTAFTMLASLFELSEKGFSTIPMDKETKYIHFMEAGRDYEWLEALILDKEIPRGALRGYRFLRSKILDGVYWPIYRPSTGALLLMTALHLCDTVSAYGFMTDNFEAYSDHYYEEEKKPVGFYINHDFLLERDLWKKLHDLGVLYLYQRP
ncbi:alpha-N-acetylgalactosaminide alpha-2,6-sialyltransferase 1-like isoform X2 [Ambystoma mexicanum]|uniref:alpha-N-acetylgalactosaminide alpha-2,6-sialyltransferase 1-like isoform X2 n=1 Tax=Ambystoma mexicanum TaxID=8296 RepID=UPI0037E8C99F